MIKRLSILLPVITLLVACNNSDNTRQNMPATTVVPVTPGKRLFMNSCMQCHSLKQDKTGPALAGVIARWGNDTTKLIAFVHNSQQVIAADGKDAYAGKLFDKWYKTSMPAFGGITDNEIRDIIVYADKGVE